MPTVDIGLGIIWYLAFLFSAVVHEAAHAWAALRLGDRTAYLGGQVSLHPWPHMRREPLGMIAVPIASFAMTGFACGWASAPFNPLWAIQRPRQAAWMAIAGPISNLALLLICALAIAIGVEAGAFAAPESIALDRVTVAANGGLAEDLAVLLSVLFSLNLLLFVFNLLPVPPLDGAMALSLLLPSTKARNYLTIDWQPRFQLVGLVAACIVFSYGFWPLHHVFSNALYGRFPGL